MRCGARAREAGLFLMDDCMGKLREIVRDVCVGNPEVFGMGSLRPYGQERTGQRVLATTETTTGATMGAGRHNLQLCLPYGRLGCVSSLPDWGRFDSLEWMKLIAQPGCCRVSPDACCCCA